MSAVLIVTCDHCGAPIETGRTVLRVETGPARDRLPTVDLCSGCWEEFATWLGRGVEDAVPRPTSPDERH
jgi:hypothetical protein